MKIIISFVNNTLSERLGESALEARIQVHLSK